MLIDLTPAELDDIRHDQVDALTSYHVEYPEDCDLAECPADHFGPGTEMEYIARRQGILRKVRG